MKQKLYLFVALLCAVTQGAWGQTGQTIDLSTLTNSSSYTIPDGATVTGTLTVTENKHCKISIAAGATITLSGVDINGQGEFVADQAGLTCLGDATIILADGTTNTICPFGVQRPAVYIPEDYTLTIRGGGTLIGNCEKCSSAVIGGGFREDCGSIVIDGGIIKAYGNKANLGNGVLAAAIGGGYDGDCGNITITSNITSLYTWIEVVREGLYCIGAGLRGDCNGVVTIGGQQLTFSDVPGGQGDDKGQVYDHEVTMYTNKVIFDSNGGSGTMNPQGIMNVSTSTFHPNNFNPAIHISNNNFSRHGYAFVMWNTEADGSGQDYYPGDVISECWSTTPGASITLYAQWMPNEDYFDQIDKGDSEDDPFEISTAQQLKWLAEHVTDVNKGHPYVGMYFKLMNDISFDYEGLGDTESNFTAIGTYGDNNYNDRYFGGHFDGDNHTISGIRIYKGGNDLADKYQGLFGYLASGAEVKNVILTDAIITGYDFVGGIVGCNNNGTVDNCHVTSSVTIRAVVPSRTELPIMAASWAKTEVNGLRASPVRKPLSAIAPVPPHSPSRMA